MAQITADNNYAVAQFIVDAVAGQGTHTTIASALSAASSGDTIFIRSGTYTENITLKAGVSLCAFVADAFTPTVTIVGKCSFSAGGNLAISGIRLQTNSDFALEVTGASATQIRLKACYISATNNTFINNNNTNSTVFLEECEGDIGTTGITLWSSTGGIYVSNCFFANNGGSTTASTNSGSTTLSNSTFGNPISTTGACNLTFSFISTSVDALTYSGTSTGTIVGSHLSAGSASALSIGTGCTVTISQSTIGSSNTNAISGSGTLNYGSITFNSTSSTLQGTLTLNTLTTLP